MYAEALYRDEFCLSIDKYFQPDPHDYFFEEENIFQVMYEGLEAVTPNNLFQKLWGLIKKSLNWVKKKVSDIISGIKSFFVFRKGTEKTLDQIAKLVLGEASIPTDELKASKPIHFGFGKDRDIEINIVAQSLHSIGKKPEIPGHGQQSSFALVKQLAVPLAFHCIKRPESLDPILRVLEEMNNTKNISGTIGQLKEEVSKFMVNTATPSLTTIRIEELVIFQDKINRFSDLVQVWDQFNNEITANHGPMSQEWIDEVNKVAQMATFLQYGTNMIASGMRQIYKLDEKYYMKIGRVEILARFVRKCIDANIPSKYIAYATKLIADEELSSARNEPNYLEDKVLKGSFGHGRFPLFPKQPDIMYKIAFNGYGIRGNRSEYWVSQAVQGTSVAQYLTNTYIEHENGAIITVERANPLVIPPAKVSELEKNINEGIAAYNLPFKVVDFNPAGFGKIGDRYVMLDYGQIRRTVPSEQHAL